MSVAEDLEGRKKQLAKLMTLLGVDPDLKRYWTDKRFLVFHYDLITIPKSISRENAYKAVEGFAKEKAGVEMSESVYAIPLPLGRKSEEFAVEFWNGLSVKTARILRTGDLFFLHYSAAMKEQMGVMAEIVGANLSDTLGQWTLPEQTTS